MSHQTRKQIKHIQFKSSLRSNRNFNWYNSCHHLELWVKNGCNHHVHASQSLAWGLGSVNYVGMIMEQVFIIANVCRMSVETLRIIIIPNLRS